MKFSNIAAGILSIAALAGCGGGGQQAQPPVNVDVAVAKRQTIATSINLDGQIAPLEQATLSFQQSGPILTMYVNVGDRVRAGQLLAQIDPSTLRAQLAQAEATARGSQIGLPVAQTSNASALATAKAAFDNARLIYRQNQQLFKQG